MTKDIGGMKELAGYKGWTMDVPEREGWFWFWGDPFTSKKSLFLPNEELSMVHIHKGSDSYVYVANGNFMENTDGLWREAVVPETPEKKTNVNNT
jgi:hypothetical protein